MRPKLVPFLDVIDDVSGGNIKTPQSEFLAEGTIPVVDQGQGLIAGYITDDSRTCKAKPPVIVFGDHTRIIKYVDFQFAMGADGTKVLAPRNGTHPKYLFHALQAIPIPSAGYSRHYKFLKKTHIPLPPLAEQKRIAGILDAADALRAKRRQAIAQLDTLLQATFLDMFGDPFTNLRRFSVKSLKTVLADAEVFTDGDWVESKDQDPNGDVRLTQLADVGDGRWLDKSGRFLTSTKAKKLRCTYLNKGDVLVARMPDPLGRACIFPGNAMTSVTVVDVCILRPNRNHLLPEYLESAINSPSVRHDIVGRSTGTTRTRISRGNLAKVNIVVPPIDEQERFAILVRGIEDQRKAQRAHLAELDTLFASLQSRAFRGEL